MKRTFRVSVVGFNADLFRDNYRQYITCEDNDYCGNVVFELRAPSFIHDEIDNLKEELIDIIAEYDN